MPVMVGVWASGWGFVGRMFKVNMKNMWAYVKIKSFKDKRNIERF